MAIFRKILKSWKQTVLACPLHAVNFLLPILVILILASCAIPTRTGYDRKTGSYKQTATAQQSQQKAQEQPAKAPKNVAVKDSASKPQARQANATTVKTAAAPKVAHEQPKTSFENYARQWLGAKYVYGAAEKTRTDCSGYVMQVYKGYWGIALNHNASNMYKDSRGSSVSRGSLKEGDLVFFGSFWKIDHVGIYLSGERFIHASTSKGVIISSMNDKYWSPKYQGGRRFK